MRQTSLGGMRQTSLCLLLMLAGVVSACAHEPHFNLNEVDSALTPATAVRDPAHTREQTVHWGGTIIRTTNLKDSTRIEVLAYPQDDSGLPDTAAKTQGRFILLQSGYIEAADYAPGRLVSVVGKLTQTYPILVGEAQVILPVVQADQLYLWPRNAQRSKMQFHFGLGVGISR